MIHPLRLSFQPPVQPLDLCLRHPKVHRNNSSRCWAILCLQIFHVISSNRMPQHLFITLVTAYLIIPVRITFINPLSLLTVKAITLIFLSHGLHTYLHFSNNFTIPQLRLTSLTPSLQRNYYENRKIYVRACFCLFPKCLYHSV